MDGDSDRDVAGSHPNDAGKAWLLLTFGDERQYAGNRGYADDAARVYRYDSYVPNHRNVSAGDVVLLQAPGRVVGFARIERIETVDGEKERQRCPSCRTTALKARRTRSPTYRCDDGHEFDVPLIEHAACSIYSAHFGDSFIASEGYIPVQELRAACVAYNGQLAMQQLQMSRLQELSSTREVYGAFERLLSDEPRYIDADDGEAGDFSGAEGYVPADQDSRDRVMRQIRARRGQASFRRSLRERYGDRCMVSGCLLVDLLEAAHISPYRGDSDQHPENGLLLRADLHTLFDLDMLGIEPELLIVHLHPDTVSAGYGMLEGRDLLCSEHRPSRAALESRWAAFTRKLRSTS